MRGFMFACVALAVLCTVGVASAEEQSCSQRSDCSQSQYCAKADGDCDGEGRCRDRPEACIMHYDPVCGCDGKTHSNACHAYMAGSSVAHAGECDGREDGCEDNAQCGEGEYCAKADGACEGMGRCRQCPEVCSQVFDPVCGCDGETYPNACSAAVDGVSVAHAGECEEDGERGDD